MSSTSSKDSRRCVARSGSEPRANLAPGGGARARFARDPKTILAGLSSWMRGRPCTEAATVFRRRATVIVLAAASMVAPAPVTAAGTGVSDSEAPPAMAETIADGFIETTAITGLTQPTTMRFAEDGRVFVTEKSGLIKVYSGLTDPTPTTSTVLVTNTYN